MTERPLVVVGAGGFGRETLDVVAAANAANPRWRLLGVIDAAPSDVNLARLSARAIPYLGTEEQWLATGESAEFLIGIGKPEWRAQVDERLTAAGMTAATVVHPAATIGTECSIGEGTVICAGVQVSTNVTLGRHTHLNPNSTIGHDATLGDFVSVNPAATLSGEVRVGDRTLIGAGAVVLFGLSVGQRSLVGASACVTRDVEDDRVVKGVPAR